MGKKQHSKDKLYIVATEYANDWGGYKKRKSQLPLRCLPFDCCGLSLLPFEDPVCTKDGIVFDVGNILPYLKKYKRNPVDGLPLNVKDLIPLKFHKNAEGAYHCPVTYKTFNNYSHIVANSKSGHVYLYEAVDQLNKKTKNWTDLMTCEPFTQDDLIVLQDPRHIARRKVEDFDYVKKGLEIPRRVDIPQALPSITKSELMERVCEDIDKHRDDKREKEKKENEEKEAKAKQDPDNKDDQADDQKSTEKVLHPLFTTHKQSTSFTSTVMEHSTALEYRPMKEHEIRQEIYDYVKKHKKKGYVRMVTTLGMINLEIHCDVVPLASDNFLRHCESGYYVGTIFHRCMKHFMIQGGDPEGTGKGGASAFKGGIPFKDEFHPKLVHKGIGVLSMANSGPNTNKSQFFITFKSCEHLNNHHTVFGQVVGALETVKKMEELPVNSKTNRPREPPSITETIIFTNPFTIAVEEMKKQKDAQEAEARRKATMSDKPWLASDGTLDAKAAAMVQMSAATKKRKAFSDW